MDTETMLTTFDNPFNPFNDFTSWFLYDVQKGYNTCSHLARIVDLNDEMSDAEVDDEIEKAFDQMIKYDFMNVYKKVNKNSFNN